MKASRILLTPLAGALCALATGCSVKLKTPLTEAPELSTAWLVAAAILAGIAAAAWHAMHTGSRRPRVPPQTVLGREIELHDGRLKPLRLTLSDSAAELTVPVLAVDGCGTVSYRPTGLHAEDGTPIWAPQQWMRL